LFLLWSAIRISSEMAEQTPPSRRNASSSCVLQGLVRDGSACPRHLVSIPTN